MTIKTYFVILLSLAGQLGVAAEIPRTEMVKMLQPFYRGVASRYEFSLDTAGNQKAALHKKPIMSWTGQEAGLVSGDVFVWIHKGRPEVVGCIGSLPGKGTRGVFHEFHSLTTDAPLPTVKLATGRAWKPKEVGIKPAEVPNADKPADSPARRMVQMRKLARDFAPRMRFVLQSRQDTGFDRLRLLPQPLYRHDVKKLQDEHPSVIDGAIFAFVWTRGTDPELLLLLEARKTDEGTKWFYAPVRFTFRELWLEHKGNEVWHHQGGNGRGTYAEPYITEFERSYTVSEVKQLAAATAK